jgi:hypothetical protein
VAKFDAADNGAWAHIEAAALRNDAETRSISTLHGVVPQEIARFVKKCRRGSAVAAAGETL